MFDHFRILALLSDGFGGFGGISKFNIDLLEALDACEIVERVYVLPRIISNPIDRPIPESVVFNRKVANNKVLFVRKLLAFLLERQKIKLVICGHLNLLPLAAIAAFFCRARLILIIHGIEAWRPRNWLVRLTTRAVVSFVSVSQFSAEKFTLWSGVPMDRAFILPNSVDLNHFRPADRDLKLAERYGLGSSKVILTVGRLAAQERMKGFDEVIDLMPQLLDRFPTLKYLIVGDGSDRQRLEAKVRTNGLSRHVVFTGRISDQEKVMHYNLADAYVMPSAGEGFGIVLIEAAACGLPIVGSKVDGSREALLNGRIGYLVNPSSQSELLEAVTSALRNTVPRRRSDLIKTFDVPNYRARVAHWIRQEYNAYYKKSSASHRTSSP